MKTYKEWSNALLVEQWGSIGLLDGINNKESLACLLEGQRRFNEKNKGDPQFLRCSIVLARRMFIEEVIDGSADALPNWHTFQGVKWDNNYRSGSAYGLDDEAEQTLAVAEKIMDQLKMMGKVSIHCLRKMEDGSIAMNYR